MVFQANVANRSKNVSCSLLTRYSSKFKFLSLSLGVPAGEFSYQHRRPPARPILQALRFETQNHIPRLCLCLIPHTHTRTQRPRPRQTPDLPPGDISFTSSLHTLQDAIPA